ncbi:MAG: putative transporter [Bacteroidales bacterium]|nr:putative transporter [Bacteroidales bacterium]
MSWIESISSDYLSTAHTILLYALIISLGIVLGKIKVCGISLGVTWVLFVGIFAGHLGLQIEPNTLHFIREFGLILFVFCIGLQVGPSFFSSFKQGGLILNLLAVGIVLLNIATALTIYYLDGETELPMIVGILYGAVTNTPGLGAANEALGQLNYSGSSLTSGYACAYPMGVVGCILSMVIIRYVCKIKLDKEETELKEHEDHRDAPSVMNIRISNNELNGKTLKEIRKMTPYSFICSRISSHGDIDKPYANTVLEINDVILVVCKEEDSQGIAQFIGESINFNWYNDDSPMVSRRILVTNSEINGRKLKDLHFSTFNVTITRVNRSGVDLYADPNLELQIGDKVMAVGKKDEVKRFAHVLGNELKRLDYPHIATIFFGICLGILVGSIPIHFPGMPTPVKLGLAGGPLIVSIILGRFGHKFRLVTYTTMSANLMLREMGISLFLASVGLSSGGNFLETILNGGLLYVAYGILITMIPIIIIGIIARYVFKINYFSIIGVIAGGTTNPAALAFASQTANNDTPAVSYSTVYPLTMFLRILSGQLILLLLM